MSDICLNCDAECVGSVFCSNGGHDNPDVSLPRTLNIQIQCNPDFWGFSGVLFSGDVTYGSNRYDYWDNFSENHLVNKSCGNTNVYYLDNEQRPDIGYRSVYDPDTGTTTYNGNDTVVSVGGPEIYLIDKDAEQTIDNPSCDGNDPEGVFRLRPDKFGFGNKILFEDDIYKNLTGAWRGFESGVIPNSGGLPDGAVAGPYTGVINESGIYRESGDPFVYFDILYNNGPASGVRNGSLIFIKNSDSSEITDGGYYVTNVSHSASSTTCKVVGSVGTDNFYAGNTGVMWVVANSYDEQTCAGQAAYGVDYVRKCNSAVPNYHADLGVVINDSRNRIHSNRKTRTKFGKTNTRSDDSSPRRAYNYVSVQESGHGLLVREDDTGDVALACETGIWSPTWDFIYTSGNNYYSSYQAKNIPDTGIAADLSLSYGSGTILGTVDIDPLPSGWLQYAVASGMYPLMFKELPFYGPFYDVYNYDNAIRHFRDDNTIKGRNLTCYTKDATLEIFPDCITQDFVYEGCGGADTHDTNQISRLAFVYRGFNYGEPCSYDASGMPYNGYPTGVDDLKNAIGGQEIYMYLNFSSARAGIAAYNPCDCLGVIPGNQSAKFVEIESPVTYPCFPKFDIDPSGYGAQDILWKYYANSILNDINYSSDSSTCPVAITGDYGYVKQPYTTYGFIRNVCGKESNSSKEVIKSLNAINTGAYKTTTPEDDTVEPLYWDFGNLVPSIPYASGLQDVGVLPSGTAATWGIVDIENRLVAPHYPIVSGSYTNNCSTEYEFADFDTKAAFRGEWPTDNVPFLIRIDHSDNCVGCDTVNMAEQNLQIKLTSLDTSYTHNDNFRWGYNHCRYTGFAKERGYTCASGFADTGVCEEEWFSTIYDDETCSCLGESGYLLLDLRAEKLDGTDIVEYWTTSNPNNSGNGFYPIEGCAFQNNVAFLGGTPEEDQDYATPYVFAFYGCGTNYNVNPFYFNGWGAADSIYGSDGLDEFYGCGGCSTSYPAVNNRSNLTLDWWIVKDQYRWVFDRLDTYEIYALQSLLEGGVSVAYGEYPGGYVNYNVLSTNLPGCDGSTVLLLGCSSGGMNDCTGGFFTSQFLELQNCDYTHPLFDDRCVEEDCYDLLYTVDDRTTDVAPFPGICGCACYDKFDVIGKYNYNSGSGQYLLDYLNFDSGCYPEGGGPYFYAITGSGIPGLGDISNFPVNLPIAKSYGNSSPQPACTWKDDVGQNVYATGIQYKFSEPGHEDTRELPDNIGESNCGGLWPKTCDSNPDCSNDSTVGKANCYNPIYNSPDVWVRRKRAHPEIMTVNKIECTGDNYLLYVSREYHTHNRTWYYPIDGYTCGVYYGGIDAGGYNWRASHSGCETAADCPVFAYSPCDSSITGVLPILGDTGIYYSIEGPLPSYYLLPMAIPSDIVTPAYPTKNDISTGESLCSFHPSSGTFPNHWVTRDFNKMLRPFEAQYREWDKIQVTGVSGVIDFELPLYTGVLDDPSASGMSCDVLSATGDLVSVWTSGNLVYLSESVIDQLTISSEDVYTHVQGTGVCSGYNWAIQQDGVTAYYYLDSDGNASYYAYEGEVSRCDPEQKYPDLEGEVLWSYFNLFYGSGIPDSRFYNRITTLERDSEAQPLCCPEGNHPSPWNLEVGYDQQFKPLFTESGDVPLQRRHSCIQDVTQCGGDIWNNKMFFPRKIYESGTRVTQFGAMSLCTQNAELEVPSWLEGYEDFNIPGGVGLLNEIKWAGLIDACDYDAHSVTLQNDVGIDDVIIEVDDYLPLIGLYSVDRKMKLGDSTCLQVASGCFNHLPIHSASTLKNITFVPPDNWADNREESLGYYLDKTVTDPSNECLFKPFKIMVDVDCCPDTMRKIGQETGVFDPTYLSWVDTEVPSVACRAFVDNARCGCSDTNCQGITTPNTCLYWYNIDDLTVSCSGQACKGGCPYDLYYATGGAPGICSNLSLFTDNVYSLSNNRYVYSLCPIDFTATSGYIQSVSVSTTTCFGGSGVTPICLANITYYGNDDIKTSDEFGLSKVSASGTIGAYECSGTIYIRENAYSYSATALSTPKPLGSPGDSCCVMGNLNDTVCVVLGNAYAMPNIGDCPYLEVTSGTPIVSEDVWKNCPCSEQPYEYYLSSGPSVCETTSNILIEIGENLSG